MMYIDNDIIKHIEKYNDIFDYDMIHNRLYIKQYSNYFTEYFDRLGKDLYKYDSDDKLYFDLNDDNVLFFIYDLLNGMDKFDNYLNSLSFEYSNLHRLLNKLKLNNPIGIHVKVYEKLFYIDIVLLIKYNKYVKRYKWFFDKLFLSNIYLYNSMKYDNNMMELLLMIDFISITKINYAISDISSLYSFFNFINFMSNK